MESCRLEKTLGINKSSHKPNTAKSTLNRVPKCHLYSSCKYLQGR